ncbi:MAG TPA: M56 family metallopeptidase, partial [Pirellulales bacterium]|nr:M56 family metallopeptidase [Pirellulales bacterium]
MALVWCAVQATLNLLAGVAIYLVARRFGPALGATAAATTLLTLCCVTLAAFSPWPRWWSLAASDDDAVGLAAGATGATTATAPVDGTMNAAPASPLKRLPAAALSFDEYWQIFRAELRAATARDPSADARWRWPAIVGALFVACASLAAGRFVIGLFALKRYRGRLSPIADAHLVELCQSLARQTGCRRPIELKQSSTLSTPATMGWRRPVIVLPSDCQSWTDAERRVVLSHELAHIARGDYLAWLLAQLAAALHVYHPLVHWLSGRLRLEQELAADAFAAELSGGREAYLFTLAQMALRQDDRRVAWAARPFLPSRGTLLRRIEMLSQTKRLRNVPVTRRRTVALAAVAGLVALLVAGIRAPVDDPAQQAQAAPPEKRTAAPAVQRADVERRARRGVEI